MVVLFYKKKRVTETFMEAMRWVLSNSSKIKVYGGSKEKAISRMLDNCEFDANGCKNFIYTWDVFKSVKLHGKILGNCTIDYRKIIYEPLNSYYFTEKGNPFCDENNAVLDSIKLYIGRLADYVNKSDISNKDRIVSYCNRFFSCTAESLEEALQRILIINQLQWQTGHILVGLGRLDLCLDRFTSEDDANAEKLLWEFFSLLHKYYVIKSNALMGDTGQIIIVGGLNADGSYFSNKYTKMIIRVMKGLALPDPKVLLRVSKTMPNEMWQDIVETWTSDMGSPLISNDDQVIPKMVAFGYDQEDASNYITSACWEPIAGNSYEQNNILSLNYLEPFEWISQSCDTRSIDSMEKLMDAYYRGLHVCIEKITKYLSTIKWEQDPLYSIFDAFARENKKDVSEGGAKYNNYGILTVALANAVNSLFNIRKYVFEKKEYTFEQFDEIRKANYISNEAFQGILRNSTAFGKDNQEVIDIVNEITAHTQSYISSYVNPFGGKLKFGLSSPHYIMNSSNYPASFDGRKANEPFSIHISAGKGVAYTELINFARALDYSGSRFNGNVVDFMLSASFVKKNFDAFVLLIKVGILNGIYQLQANVVDSKTLIAAKNDPQRFPNLIVRVWGFNAYFNDLPEEYKDYLIERALQSEHTYN